ncbi:hypothetical protein Ahia01_000109900, partial [Argonauta hians]
IWFAGRPAKALVDTGSNTTVVAGRMVRARRKGGSIRTVDGRAVSCEGTATVQLSVRGITLRVEAVALSRVMAGVDVVLGMDAIKALGGVTVDGNGVRFGREASAVDPISPSSNATTGDGESSATTGDGEITTHTIEDVDFRAEFTEGRWVVRWVWKDQPPVLKNRVGCYGSTVKRGCQEEFDREVGRWIQEGILRRWEGQETGGVLPLMAVLQPTKGKVRPVLDFRELNDHVMCHTGGDVVDVCGETLRAWRRVSDRASIVDLKSAYLQLH